MPAMLIFNNLSKKWINCIIPIVVSLIILSNLVYYSPPTDYAKISLLSTLPKYTGQNVASTYTDAYQVAMQNKSVILGAFAESLPDFETKYFDLNELLAGNFSCVKTYNLSYFFTNNTYNLPIIATNGFYKIYSFVNNDNATVA